MEFQWTLNTQNNLRKEQLVLPGFKTYNKTTVVKTV